MKVRILVRLKQTVHDPQGEAILQSLHHMNYMDIAAIRQGKVFDIELKDVNEAKSKALLDEIARKILANPIIEEYAIEWE